MEDPSLAVAYSRKTFQDATTILLHGTACIEPGQILNLPEFTLMDAMNAIEVMDPRMDSGVELPSDTCRASFDPLSPLLPEEVCYIIDQALACEMAFHTGLTLSQSAYTVLYSHPSALEAIQLNNYIEGVRSQGKEVSEDDRRPMELLCIVLRAAMIGMNKTLGLVWDELMRGNLYEGEDFSADKFGLSLCDDLTVEDVLEELDAAIEFLMNEQGEFHTSIPEPWRSALLVRIKFRKELFLAIHLTLLPLSTQQPSQSDSHLTPNPPLPSLKPLRAHLYLLRKSLLSSPPSPPIPKPSSDSPVHAAFDPTINRKLVSHIPLAVVDVGDETLGLERLGEMIDGLEMVGKVVQSLAGNGRTEAGGQGNVVQLMNFLVTRSASPIEPPLSPFIRSLLITTIYSSSTRLSFLSLPLSSLTASYLSTTTSPPLPPLPSPPILAAVVAESEGLSIRPWGGPDGNRGPTLRDAVNVFQQRLAGFLVNSLTNFCQNRSRQKRLAGKSFTQWEELLLEAADLAPFCAECLSHAGYPQPLPTSLFSLPLSIQLHRLLLAREALFSGFDLSLYDPILDHPFIYWAAARLCTVEVRLLDELGRRFDEEVGDAADGRQEEGEGRRTREGWREDARALKGLGGLCYARFLSSVRPAQPNPTAESLRFGSRFKWIVQKPTPAMTGTAVDAFIFHPTHEQFAEERDRLLTIEEPVRQQQVQRHYQQAAQHIGAGVPSQAFPPYGSMLAQQWYRNLFKTAMLSPSAADEPGTHVWFS